MALDVQRFLEDLSTHNVRHYLEAVRELVRAIAMQDRPALSAARRKMEGVITETMGVAEVVGATQTLRSAAETLPEIAAAFKRSKVRLLEFADTTTQALLPRVTLEEAIEDLVSRTPVTIRRAAERTAQRIAQLYSEGRVVAFARSAEAAVTKRVQDLIAEAAREGIPEANAGRLIRMGAKEVSRRTADWTEAYSRMAFRTNVNTAVTAGRFRQSQDPDIKAVTPAFRFDAVGDNDTRPNHLAANKKILLVDNALWNRIAPPLGYS